MATITQSPLEMPLPPATLKATDADLQALREVVQRLGWHETLFRVCELLAEEYGRLPDCTKKGAIKMVANSLSMIVPSAHWIDEPLVLNWPEKQSTNE
jgi:hypothetical protein